MSNPFWDEYARVQHLVEIGVALDVQLGFLLQRFIDKNLPLDLRDTRRRLKNLQRNTFRNQRSRVSLLKRHAKNIGSTQPPSPVAVALDAEVRQAVRNTAGDDWSIFESSIDGDYAALAMQFTKPVGTLKARVSRTRAKLRGKLVEFAPEGFMATSTP